MESGAGAPFLFGAELPHHMTGPQVQGSWQRLGWGPLLRWYPLHKCFGMRPGQSCTARWVHHIGQQLRLPAPQKSVLKELNRTLSWRASRIPFSQPCWQHLHTLCCLMHCSPICDLRSSLPR